MYHTREYIARDGGDKSFAAPSTWKSFARQVQTTVGRTGHNTRRHGRGRHLRRVIIITAEKGSDGDDDEGSGNISVYRSMTTILRYYNMRPFTNNNNSEISKRRHAHIL